MLKTHESTDAVGQVTFLKHSTRSAGSQSLVVDDKCARDVQNEGWSAQQMPALIQGRKL